MLIGLQVCFFYQQAILDHARLEIDSIMVELMFKTQQSISVRLVSIITVVCV